MLPLEDESTKDDHSCKYWSFSFRETASLNQFEFGIDCQSHIPEKPQVLITFLTLFIYSDFILLFLCI